MPDTPAAIKNPALQQVSGFELLEKIGQGGMGSVFKARQISLDRIVALKVLPPSIAKNAQFIERFMREARAAGRLNHPNIVQGIDAGQCEETLLYYFAMEFINGQSLGQQLDKCGALPESFVHDVARQMGEALACANQNGLVHRDIKPDNILMDSQGMAKLADLGLAKQISREDASLTQSGQALGTPFYMSPEQVRGEIDQIDTRTDLYGLGATLFHLVTGQPPYDGATNAVVMAAHLTAKIPLAHQVNPDVSEGFSRLLQSLMQKEKIRRPLDPRAFLEQLAALGDPEKRVKPGASGTTGPRNGIRSASPRDRNRSPVGPQDRISDKSAAKSRTPIYVVGCLLAVLLLGGGLLVLSPSGRNEPSRVTLKEKKPEPITAPVPDPVPVSLASSRPDWDASVEKERHSASEQVFGPLPTITVDLAPGVKMEFVLVKAGEFEMGSNDGAADEKPAHKVKISKSYYIARYETTVAQFKAFIEATKYVTEAEKGTRGWGWKNGRWGDAEGLTWRSPGFEQAPDQPATVITWNDAQEFCKWATQQAKRTVHLPSEAQWEYAARGAENRKYPWGNKEDWTLLNHADAAMKGAGVAQPFGSSSANDRFAFTAPVGSYKDAASWCGAFDMAGNVWEWVEDRYDGNYYASSPAVDPSGPATGKDRLLRGGGWFNGPGRSTCRLKNGAGLRNVVCGFRCAMEK